MDLHKELVCMIANTSDKEQVIPKGQQVGVVEGAVIQEETKSTSLKPPAMPKKAAQLEGLPAVDLSKLPDDLRSKTEQLIWEFCDIFAEELKELGKLKGFKCTIDFKSEATPVHLKDYRKSQAKHAEVRKVVKDKLEKGMIEPGTES